MSVPAIEDMASLGQSRVFLLGENRDVSATLALTAVSFNILDVLGVRPAAGRGFSRADALARAGVGMITYEAWEGRSADEFVAYMNKFKTAGTDIGTAMTNASTALTNVATALNRLVEAA